MRKLRGPLTLIIQLLFIVLLAVIGNSLAVWMGLSIPGSLISLILVFLSLQLKLIKLKWIEDGANWLLSKLLLFFIPSLVGIVQFPETFLNFGIPLFIIVLTTTLVVMVSSGIIADQLAKTKKEQIL